MAAKKPSLMKRLMERVFEYFHDGSLRPIVPITTYPISKVDVAFRTLQSGKAMGKIVIKPEVDDQVMVCYPNFFMFIQSLFLPRYIYSSGSFSACFLLRKEKVDADFSN